MRSADLRIASKHRAEAAARTMSAASERAYKGSLRWETSCREREQEARGRLIRAQAEPFVRDPESWQAVAAAGRKYA
jgi:hypothetical protein